MAKLQIGGKRDEVEGKVLTSASCGGDANQFSNFNVVLKEEGEFGKRSFRYHTLNLTRDEAEQIVKSIREALDTKRQANGRFK